MRRVKIGLVYTVTGPELVEAVEREVCRACLSAADAGADAIEAAGGLSSATAGAGEAGLELLSYSDPSILADATAAGHVTRDGAARLVGLYMAAVRDGADAILNCCSTVGEVADSAQGLAAYLDVPIVRIDEAMCRAAVRVAMDAAGERTARVGVLATVATTLGPTGGAIQRGARALGAQVEIENALATGAAGLQGPAFAAALLKGAREMAPRVDALVLAQGSMAWCEGYLHGQLDVPVLSSPRFGARAVRAALERAGKL